MAIQEAEGTSEESEIDWDSFKQRIEALRKEGDEGK
jgi:hypothetical protein